MTPSQPEEGLRHRRIHAFERAALTDRPVAKIHELLSPQFEYHGWRICPEHQRGFRSVVLKWLWPASDTPNLPRPAVACPPSDRRKGWAYRVKLDPEQIEVLWGLLDNRASLAEIEFAFHAKVEEARALGFEKAKELASKRDPLPRKLEATIFVYDRNPYVFAAVLIRADGICEKCGNLAPFRRRSDGSPYLEVHHIVPLASGGLDTIENALALCPNCHRAAHYA